MELCHWWKNVGVSIRIKLINIVEQLNKSVFKQPLITHWVWVAEMVFKVENGH